MVIKKRLIKHADKVRFASTGAVNVLLDFSVLNILSLILGMPTIFANTISTGLVMTQSFLLNKKWVFRKRCKNYMREIILFFVFTVTGLWVINNGIVYLTTTVLPAGWGEFWRMNIAKGLATIASGIWHYLAYKYIVFKDGHGAAFEILVVD